MRWTLSIIWLIFAALFSLLGYSHWVESKSAIPPFELTQRAMDSSDSGIRAKIWIKGTLLDKPIEDFVNDFNEYISVQNQTSQSANKRAAKGYFLAASTAIISMLLEWRDIFKSGSLRREQSA